MVQDIQERNAGGIGQQGESDGDRRLCTSSAEQTAGEQVATGRVWKAGGESA